MFYSKIIKRLIDVVLSFIGIVVLSWLFILTGVIIFIDDPGNIFFSQNRIGLNKKQFKLYKFRTMKTSTPHDVPTHLLKNPEEYITRFGKFLRKSSLDEIPQMWNILIGDMSIIGPRPALWNQDDLIKKRDERSANKVRPGLTGLAQISGRDEINISEKAKLDGDYADILLKGGFKAFFFDCKLFFKTILSVFKAEGVVEGEQRKD